MKAGFSFGQDKVHPIMIKEAKGESNKMDGKADVKSSLKRSTTLGPSSATQIIPESSTKDSRAEQLRARDRQRNNEAETLNLDGETPKAL